MSCVGRPDSTHETEYIQQNLGIEARNVAIGVNLRPTFLGRSHLFFVHPGIFMSGTNCFLQHLFNRLLELRRFEGSIFALGFLLREDHLGEGFVVPDGLSGWQAETTKEYGNKAWKWAGVREKWVRTRKTNPPVLVPPIRSKTSAGMGGLSSFLCDLIRSISSSMMTSSDKPRIPPPSLYTLC